MAPELCEVASVVPWVGLAVCAVVWLEDEHLGCPGQALVSRNASTHALTSIHKPTCKAMYTLAFKPAYKKSIKKNTQTTEYTLSWNEDATSESKIGGKNVKNNLLCIVQVSLVC